MSYVGGNETLTAAKAKLQAGWSLENLPLNNNDILWEVVKKDCDLTNPQLSSLKNIIFLRNTRNNNGKLLLLLKNINYIILIII